MEGNLKKFTNFLRGYKSRYFILFNDNILSYYKEKVYIFY